jgi:predicted AlkP superfamily phosphohydrolase/phosphomutase
MTARHLVVGLDGADLDIVRELGPERLPALWSAMSRGAFAHQRSVHPPATLPNWTTFLTGLDPAAHGVFDFTTRHGYSVRFTAGSAREAPTIAARLDRLGYQTAVLGFPATYPPERLERGVFMSGWDAPVAFEADSSFVWPRSLYDDIRNRFGAHSFDDVNEFDADRPGWHRELPGALAQRIERKVELCRWLLAQRAWDLFAVYFGESDTAMHYLYSLHDPSSPRRPASVSAEEAEGLSRVYARLDAALGELLREAGSEVELTVVSDHGAGGSSDKVLYLNRALADAGLLHFRPSKAAPAAVRSLKEAALTTLPPSLKERVFRWGGAALPSWLESQARYGAIDMRKTAAFSDELNYFPAVHLNLRGREPRGTVSPGDAERVRRDVEAALLALRDPWTGEAVVSAVHRREDLFEGPYLDRAPDLVVDLTLDRGYSYNLMPSSSGPEGGALFRRLAEGELLGRKGRSLPGSHRLHGLYVASGPRVEATGEIASHIADATATLLARMDVAVPPEMIGRVRWDMLRSVGRFQPLPTAQVRSPERAPDRSRVEARLRALGYVD